MTAPERETAYAKINLALHVRARRADGYHEIETLFAFAQDGDALEGVLADDVSLSVSGAYGGALQGETDNLVLRAANALRKAFGIAEGVAFRLDKRLPVAAGVGGGSADAAAAMRLLSRLWNLDRSSPEFMAIARDLGADVPACIASRTCFGHGRGDALKPHRDASLEGTPLLLVNPLIPLSTAAVFAGWNGEDRGALDPSDWRTGRNDLELPAIGLVPEIGTLLGDLAAQRGAKFVRMSGSGATCFALFDTSENCAAAGDALSRFWTMRTAIR